VEADQRSANDARTAGWDETRVDEDFVSTESAVAALLEGDAVGERLIGDGMLQAVGYAAIPGHVET
jgi:hypothetical protein